MGIRELISSGLRLKYIVTARVVKYMLLFHNNILTCTRFQLGESSATGSVATEQSAPINITRF